MHPRALPSEDSRASSDSLRHDDVSWSLFDAVADSVSDAVLVVDAQLVVRSCNARTERMLGYVSDDLVGSPLSRLLSPRDRLAQTEQLAECVARAFEGASPVTLRLTGLTKAGAELPLKLKLRVLRASGLALITIRSLAHSDSFDRLRSTQQLAQARATTGFHAAPHGTALLDAAGRVIAIDDAWRALDSERSLHDILWADVGAPFLGCVIASTEPSLARARAGVQAVLSGEQAKFDTVYACHAAERIRWFSLRAHRLESPPGSVLLAQLDVTEVQLAHARLSIQNAVAAAFNARMPVLAAARQLVTTLCDELDWDFASIWTRSAQSDAPRCIDSWSRPALALQRHEAASRSAVIAAGTGLVARAWSTRSVLWVTDDEVSAQVQREWGVLASEPATPAMRTALCFPIHCGDEVLAVVEVFSRIRRSEHVALMALLAVSGNQLALWELRERAERTARSAQQEADQARVQLESVLSCTPAFITAIGRDERLMFVNKTIPPERRASAYGAPWRDYVVPECHGLVEDALRKVLADGTPVAYEAKISIPGGHWLWFANFMGPMRAGDEVVGVVIISQDVTATKRSHEELLEAQRLAAVGTLAAGVAHEINTPVQFVSDSLQFLREATQDHFKLIDALLAYHRLSKKGAEASALAAACADVEACEDSADLEYMHVNVPKAFDRCVDGLERVSTIVRSMKEFSHPAQKSMAPVDLNRAIMATLTVARNEYKYIADLETDLGELPPVVCHPNEINQAVLNIVVNAAHAIADATPKQERGLITVQTRQEGDWVVIRIGDSGGGIPEAIRQRIFEPFFTTKEVGRGTGQGLSIAWAAVKEKHGGELRFETVMGKGTTFSIRLPLRGRQEGAS